MPSSHAAMEDEGPGSVRSAPPAITRPAATRAAADDPSEPKRSPEHRDAERGRRERLGERECTTTGAGRWGESWKPYSQ